MARTTPFHARVAAHNRTGLWKHWAGFLVPPNLQDSINAEYYAIRNAVSLLDTSPLHKLRFSGPEARPLLERALARDIGACPVGRAQYTCWCDDAGFVVQDGVVLHVAPDEYLLTAAEPTLRTFRQIARDRGLDPATATDVTNDFGILALQGPHAFSVLAELNANVADLRYFGVKSTTIAGCPVTVSRTGYTGDLGYEIWTRQSDAETVWDAIYAAGTPFNITPIGTTAMKMARVEAGLLLMGVDFHSARFAWTDAQRETPLELGWGWMFRKLARDDRDFIGRGAIEKEIEEESSRWRTVGLAVDPEAYEKAHAEAGIIAPRHELYAESTMRIYRRGTKEWDDAGYASSFLASTLLRRPIALAKLPPDLQEPGSEVDLEVLVIRNPKNILARVEPLPFFDPPRRTAPVREEAVR